MHIFKTLIGIAAYNAENNIVNLVKSLLNQNKDTFEFDLLVHSDNSSDGTVSILKSQFQENFKIIDNKVRKGFAGSVKYILSAGRSYDATLVLNDDIIIKDKYFLEKLIQPLIENNNLGLISGNPVPLKANNFIEQAGNTSFNIYNNLRYSYKNGDNKWTADGKVLLYSKKYIQTIEYPVNDSEMGNVDAYMYFMCLQKKLKYKHVKDAIVYYKMPSSFKEYVKWDSRNKSNKFLLSNKFGELVDREYKLPKLRMLKFSLKELLINPLGVLFLFFLRFYTKIQGKKSATSFDSKWEVITTTKNIRNE